MALVMSATAIHARGSADPAATVGALLASLADELRETEMFLTVCYAGLTGGKGKLSYANTGHPHAFVVREDGTITRLSAESPPLGMTEEAPNGSSVEWKKGSDLLVLFTDGVSDARNSRDERLGEERVLEIVAANRTLPTPEILEAVFTMLRGHITNVRIRDDLTLVVLRS